ncbi:MAG: hypothetical protein AAF215_19815 [Cyanobacteria bacterium P01_A01_bin.123]
MLKTHVPLKIQSTQLEPTQIIELSMENLEVIVGGSSESKGSDDISGDAVSANHNETLVDIKESTPTQSTQIVELSVEDLAAIVGGYSSGNDNEHGDGILLNHNETLLETTQKTNSAQPKLVKLSAEDLTLICGGRSKEDDEPVSEG